MHGTEIRGAWDPLQLDPGEIKLGTDIDLNELPCLPVSSAEKKGGHQL